MLIFIVGTTLCFIAGSLLAVATRLYYKDEISLMQEDYLDALRKEREDAYLAGYVNGISDEKIVQTAKKHITSPDYYYDDSTMLIPVSE